MTPRRRRQIRKARSRAAGQTGAPRKVLREFHAYQSALVSEMQLQKLIRLHGGSPFMGMDFGFSSGQTVLATFREDQITSILVDMETGDPLIATSTGLPKVDLKFLAAEALLEPMDIPPAQPRYYHFPPTPSPCPMCDAGIPIKSFKPF